MKRNLLLAAVAALILIGCAKTTDPDYTNETVSFKLNTTQLPQTWDTLSVYFKGNYSYSVTIKSVVDSTQDSIATRTTTNFKVADILKGQQNTNMTFNIKQLDKPTLSGLGIIYFTQFCRITMKDMPDSVLMNGAVQANIVTLSTADASVLAAYRDTSESVAKKATGTFTIKQE